MKNETMPDVSCELSHHDYFFTQMIWTRKRTNKYEKCVISPTQLNSYRHNEHMNQNVFWTSDKIETKKEWNSDEDLVYKLGQKFSEKELNHELKPW